ncbi:hypothetical protein [Acrocarpospora sp. B8E8]|uniref:hypothetical protein n=1 Tax=Acrocarpospora sp. B8E8 TaxID=3153572 RepID=UPI00325ECC0D
MSRAAALDHPGLWDLPIEEPEPEEPVSPSPKAAAKPRSRRRHLLDLDRPKRDKAWNELPCDPRCLTCGKAEGQGLCHAPSRCAVVCVHTHQPARAEVCLIVHHVTAVLVRGAPSVLWPSPGHAVILCPGCGGMHWHGARYGVAVRTGPCGTPYVVHLARPTITAAGEQR